MSMKKAMSGFLVLGSMLAFSIAQLPQGATAGSRSPASDTTGESDTSECSSEYLNSKLRALDAQVVAPSAPAATTSTSGSARTDDAKSHH